MGNEITLEDFQKTYQILEVRTQLFENFMKINQVNNKKKVENFEIKAKLKEILTALQLNYGQEAAYYNLSFRDFTPEKVFEIHTSQAYQKLEKEIQFIIFNILKKLRYLNQNFLPIRKKFTGEIIKYIKSSIEQIESITNFQIFINEVKEKINTINNEFKSKIEKLEVKTQDIINDLSELGKYKSLIKAKGIVFKTYNGDVVLNSVILGLLIFLAGFLTTTLHYGMDGIISSFLIGVGTFLTVFFVGYINLENNEKFFEQQRFKIDNLLKKIALHRNLGYNY